MSINDPNKIQNEIDKKFWEPYLSQTIILSTICRQLAFAEGGICFFFVGPGGQHSVISPDIGFILKLLVLFFVFDFFQYLAATIIYYCVARCYEHHIESLKELVDVEKSVRMNLPSLCFFILKMITLGITSNYIVFKLL